MSHLLQPTNIEFKYKNCQLRSCIDEQQILWFSIDDISAILGIEIKQDILEEMTLFKYFAQTSEEGCVWVSEACLCMIIFDADIEDDQSLVDRVFSEIITKSRKKLSIKKGVLIA